MPAKLAGITGPCPHCGTEITSPKSSRSGTPEETVEKEPEAARPSSPPRLEPLKPRTPAAPPAPKPVETSFSRPDHKSDPATKATNRHNRRNLSRWILRGVLLILLAIILYWFLGFLGLVGPQKSPAPVEAKSETSKEETVTSHLQDSPKPSPPIVIEPSTVLPE